jgi:hypothetical protein
MAGRTLEQLKEEIERLSSPTYKPIEPICYGEIYLIHGSPISQAGLIGYIGQTTDSGVRRRSHLSGKYDGTRMLIETIRAKGCTPTYQRIIGCRYVDLDAKEREWYTRYKNSGWTLWNRQDLTIEGFNESNLTPGESDMDISRRERIEQLQQQLDYFEASINRRQQCRTS